MRTAADAGRAAQIRVVHGEDNTYGAPRVTAELNDGAAPEGRVNHKRIARVMREHGIAEVRLRRRVRTTVPEPSDQKVPDLLKRDFTAAQPNRKYVGDITYLALADGTSLELACSSRPSSTAIRGAWPAGLWPTTCAPTSSRPPSAMPWRPEGAWPGDLPLRPRPRQYTSKDFAELCAQLGVTQSMGAVGTSAANAVAEAFNATLKRELLQGAPAWPDELTCRREIFRWATRYNTRRRHSWCGQQAPNSYEQQTAENDKPIRPHCAVTLSPRLVCGRLTSCRRSACLPNI